MLAITGGTGFIGQWLLQIYGDTHSFIVPCLGRELDDPSVGSRWVQKPGITYVASDFSKESLSKVFDGAEAVVHLAAARPIAGDNSLAQFLPNISLSESVFLAALDAGVTNIVSVSSRSVYGDAPTPWREDMQPHPQGGYAIAKRTVELLADDLCKSRGAKIKTLRLAQVMGHGERSGYLIATLMQRAAQRLPLQVYGTGAGRREYLYVKDVCRALIQAANQPQVSGVFNIGTGQSTSILELAHAVSAAFGGGSCVQTLPDKPEDLSVSLMDVSLAKEQLGFEASFPLMNALIDMRMHTRA